MFCPKCLQFCENWVQATVANLSDDGDIIWTNHRQVLHDSIMELEKSSSGCCCICRSIWHYLSQLASSSLRLITTILLEVMPDRGSPVLRASFVNSLGHEVLPTRMIALYLGKTPSSTSTDPYANHSK